MDITYKKLFEIDINNKRFAIFIDNNKRKTFLEIDNSGNYKYPLLEDFIYLNDIYNNKDIFTVYVPRFKYTEKIRVGSILLSVVLITGSLSYKFGTSYKVKYNKDEESIAISEEYDHDKYGYLSKFDDYFGYEKVSVREIEEAINNNHKLNQEFKNIAYKLLYRILSIDKDIDLRIFYENIKTLQVNTFTLEALNELYGTKSIAGSYNSKINSINITDNDEYNTKVHEMAHTIYHFYRNNDNRIYCHTVKTGQFLDEAMNTEVENLVNYDSVYAWERAVLNYLQTTTPFTIKDYYTIGVDGYINVLKEKYPDIDIDYIVDTLDAQMTTEAKLGGRIPLNSSPFLLDEIFKITIENIDLNSPYESYNNFIKLLKYADSDDLKNTFLDKYNNALKKIGFSKVISKNDINSMKKELNKVNYIAYNESVAYPIYQEHIYAEVKAINENGEEFEITSNDNFYFMKITSDIREFMYDTIPYYYNIIGTNEYFHKIALENEKTIDNNIKTVEISLNDNIISKGNINNYQVLFGLNSYGNLVYILKNNDSIIYQSDNDLVEIIDELPLVDYVINNNQINLEEYFNTYYLKYWLIGNPDMILNISFDNGKIIFTKNEEEQIIRR